MKTLLAVALLAINSIALADVKMTIYREMPNGQEQVIVQQFDDEDAWMMWMQMKFDNGGCDPYVTHFTVNLHYDTLDSVKEPKQ